MKKFLILQVAIWFLSLYATAADPTQIIEQANQAYIQGEYLYSIELYEQVLAMELESAELYYNLGNSYFKANRLAPAILNYERALQMKPFDENIKYNLEIARSRIIDRIDPVPVIFYERWWKAFIYLFDIDRWAVSGLIALFLGLICLLWYLFSGKVVLRKLTLIMSVVLLMVAGMAFLAAHRQHIYHYDRQDAIVFIPRVTAKSAPGTDSPDLFVIHEGTKVTITDTLGEWAEIRLANGNVGWLQMSAITPVRASGVASPSSANG
jgi:tetratricopeptide (TPR) repeat protein